MPGRKDKAADAEQGRVRPHSMKEIVKRIKDNGGRMSIAELESIYVFEHELPVMIRRGTIEGDEKDVWLPGHNACIEAPEAEAKAEKTQSEAPADFSELSDERMQLGIRSGEDRANANWQRRIDERKLKSVFSSVPKSAKLSSFEEEVLSIISITSDARDDWSWQELVEEFFASGEPPTQAELKELMDAIDSLEELGLIDVRDGTYYTVAKSCFTAQEREELRAKVRESTKQRMQAIDDLASAFIDAYPCLTVGRERKIWIYGGRGIWKPEGEVALRKFIYAELGSAKNTRTVHEIVENVKDRSAIGSQEFHKPPKNLICMENGALNLETYELEPFSAEHYFTARLPLTLDKGAECTAILKFLGEVVAESDLPLVQEWIGYTLLPDYRIHAALFCVGERMHGKSTFLNLLVRFLGRANVASLPLQVLEQDKNRFASAKLHGKFANICQDISDKAFYDSSLYRRLTGGDLISGEKKFGDIFEFYNHAKMVFSANKLPRVAEDNEAFYRRYCELPFPFDFEGKADTKILEKLTTDGELSGLLNWAIIGLKRLLDKGEFSNQKSIAERRDIYIHKSDSVRAFIMDELEFDSLAFLSTKELVGAYNAYCRDKRMVAVSEGTFVKRFVKDAEARADRAPTNERGFRGVKFKDAAGDATKNVAETAGNLTNILG